MSPFFRSFEANSYSYSTKMIGKMGQNGFSAVGSLFSDSLLAQSINYTEESIVVGLVDGRTVSAPLVWFPRLSQATRKQFGNWTLLGDGEGIHWPEIDEDLSVLGLLAGTHWQVGCMAQAYTPYAGLGTIVHRRELT